MIALNSDIMLQDKKKIVRKNSIMSLVENGLNVIPFVPVGTIIKNVANHIGTYRDVRFAQKLEIFLCPLSEDFDKDQFESFWKGAGDKKQNISQYLIGLLDAAETDEKADMMGCVYHAAVLGKIDHDEMLRFCDVIKKCYVADLMSLPQYIDPNDEDSIIVQNLTNLGLIDNYAGGSWKGKPDVKQNAYGHKLYDILSSEGYF